MPWEKGKAGSENTWRWAEHAKNPDSAVPWDEVRQKLLDRE
jgi:hypothetical protein